MHHSGEGLTVQSHFVTQLYGNMRGRGLGSLTCRTPPSLDFSSTHRTKQLLLVSLEAEAQKGRMVKGGYTEGIQLFYWHLL